jgi:phage gpG-like protein
MAQQTYIKADISELNKIIKDMGHNFYTRVGIIGGNAMKPHMESKKKDSTKKKSKRVASSIESGMTMAEIGAIHEFGSLTNNIPPRSFLRMPIEEKKKDLIRFLSSPTVRAVIAKGDVKRAFKMLGTEAVGIVMDAFRSRGFGRWADNKQQTIDRKGSDAPLIDTGELRKSITYDVKSK